MSQIIEKPDGYVSSRVQNYKSKAVLLLYADEDQEELIDKEVIGDSACSFEVFEDENNLIIREVA